ncbi:hypothetical protein KGF57_000707 [Candida theae]|uniref:Uncharacterized protein n=1 Tax=Candida theae TaxID=1198502 RepID=A0AAD5BIA3_9ASCO|nr:uncharacterized protein KGF57_000707 [Candida theae]KAI5965441.1 hypothetical protein KGF57_000707 [Candida theae]
MSPTKQSRTVQASGQSLPPVPFKLTLYPPSLRPDQEQEEEEISIELSTDEELDQEERYPDEATRDIEQLIEESSDKELFRAKLKRLERDSLRRFENKWTGIISKYSNINDEQESDEIDLVTGEIVTNNGHLHRLRSGANFSNISSGKGARRLTTFKLWREPNGQHDQSGVRTLDKGNSKSQEKNIRRMRIPSPSKSARDSLTNGDFLRNVSPTKGQVPTQVDKDESPTKKRRIFVQQDTESSSSEYSEAESETSSDYSIGDASEDDEPYEESSDSDGSEEASGRSVDFHNNTEMSRSSESSKSKQFKPLGSSISKSPKLSSNEGPLSQSTPDPESPLKAAEREEHKQKLSPEKTEIHRYTSNKSSDLNVGDDSVQNLSNLFLEHSSPKHNKIHSRYVFNTKDDSENSPFLDESLAMNTPQKDKTMKLIDVNVSPIKSLSTTLASPPRSASCESFEEQINIVEEPYYFMGDAPSSSSSSSKLMVFKCCVTDCSFCTMNKKLYASHLIKHHSSLLYQLGYPTEADLSGGQETENQLTGINKKRLFHEFPLRFKSPLPLHTHVCDRIVNGDKCQMFYLCKEDLIKHRSSGKCNSQSQIIFCPILGCGYMTDGGYEDWRGHLINAGHCESEPHENSKASHKVSAMDNEADGSIADDVTQIVQQKSQNEILTELRSITNTSLSFNSLGGVSITKTAPKSQNPSKHSSTLSNLRDMASLAKPSPEQVETGYESIEELFK